MGFTSLSEIALAHAVPKANDSMGDIFCPPRWRTFAEAARRDLLVSSCEIAL